VIAVSNVIRQPSSVRLASRDILLIRQSTNAKAVHQIASRAHLPDLTNVMSAILDTLLIAEEDASNAMTATVTYVIHQHSAAQLANQDTLWTAQHQLASQLSYYKLES